MLFIRLNYSSTLSKRLDPKDGLIELIEIPEK